jgi:hypothetical protein
MTGWYHNFHAMLQDAQSTIFIVLVEQKLKDKPTKRQLVLIANAWDADDKVIGYCDHIGTYHIGNDHYATQLTMEGEARQQRMISLLREIDKRYAVGIISQSPLAGLPITYQITEPERVRLLEEQIKKELLS